jgi:hypothetical protein
MCAAGLLMAHAALVTHATCQDRFSCWVDGRDADSFHPEEGCFTRYVLVMLLLTACAAAGQELPVDADKIKTPTVEQANVLTRHKGELFLNGLATLVDQAAEALR